MDYLAVLAIYAMVSLGEADQDEYLLSGRALYDSSLTSLCYLFLWICFTELLSACLVASTVYLPSLPSIQFHLLGVDSSLLGGRSFSKLWVSLQLRIPSQGGKESFSFVTRFILFIPPLHVRPSLFSMVFCPFKC